MQGKRWSYHDQDSFKGALSSSVWFDNVYLRGWRVSGMGAEPSSWWRWAARNSYSFLSFPACESSSTYTLSISIYLLWVICLGDNIRVMSWSNESDVVTFQDGTIRTEGKRRESKEILGGFFHPSSLWLLTVKAQNLGRGDFPGSQMVKTPCSHVLCGTTKTFLKIKKKNLGSDQAQWNTCWGAGSLVHCYSHNTAWVMLVLGSCACLMCPVWMLLENRWNHAEFVNGRCQVIQP